MWVRLPRVFRWLTPSTQSTRVSEQEGFLVAVDGVWFLCSDMTEELEGAQKPRSCKCFVTAEGTSQSQ